MKVPLYIIKNEIEGILVCLTFNDLTETKAVSGSIILIPHLNINNY